MSACVHPLPCYNSDRCCRPSLCCFLIILPLEWPALPAFPRYCRSLIGTASVSHARVHTHTSIIYAPPMDHYFFYTTIQTTPNRTKPKPNRTERNRTEPGATSMAHSWRAGSRAREARSSVAQARRPRRFAFLFFWRAFLCGPDGCAATAMQRHKGLCKLAPAHVAGVALRVYVCVFLCVSARVCVCVCRRVSTLLPTWSVMAGARLHAPLHVQLSSRPRLRVDRLTSCATPPQRAPLRACSHDVGHGLALRC